MVIIAATHLCDTFSSLRSTSRTRQPLTNHAGFPAFFAFLCTDSSLSPDRLVSPIQRRCHFPNLHEWVQNPAYSGFCSASVGPEAKRHAMGIITGGFRKPLHKTSSPSHARLKNGGLPTISPQGSLKYHVLRFAPGPCQWGCSGEPQHIRSGSKRWGRCRQQGSLRLAGRPGHLSVIGTIERLCGSLL